MKRFLEAECYRVELAEDAMSLSQVIEASHLDLMFLDVDLPWVNGIELCQLLKEHPVLGKIPIILTSQKTSKSVMEQAFAAGCDEYLVKPFGADIMSEAVQKVFGENL